MKNIFSKLTVAAALAMSLAAGAGDIYEILPCDATGATLSGPVTSVADPVGGGEMCYFKVRLMKPAASTPTQWQLVALNGLDKSEVGFYVYVSGELRKATYQGVQLDASTSLRDFVFGFETKNGDFALPVVLATASGERADTASDEYLSYKLLNAGSWGFYLDGDTTTAAAELTFKTTVDYNVQKPEDGARIMDQTLAKAGFYVKAIDFDSNYYDEDELADPRVWRSIHQNGTTCVDMSLPSVTVGGSGATSAVSVWVWTEDPAVAEIWESGTETVTGLKADHVTPYTTKALKLTLLPGETTKSFRIKGKGAVGATTTVYMADTKTNIFDKAGLLLPNSVTRTVAVGEPEKPNLQIGFGNDLQESCTITADSDYKTYKVELMTVLSEAYTDATQPIKVKLAASYADGSGALDLSVDDNVVFSATGKGAGWSLPVDTVTIDAGGTTGRFYVYVRGASAATENGIVLTATIDGTGSDYYDVAGATAELTLNRTAPDISAMAGLEFAGAFTGEAFAFEGFAVVDTYANLQQGGTTGYTVSYKRTYSAGGGDGTYQTATFKTGLDGTASGDPLKIVFARAGDTTVEMFVTAPDGTKSAVVTFTVKDVQQSPQVNATVTSGLSSEGYAEEGATLKIAIDLGEAENSTAAPLYAYLYPADDETAQNVQTCDALATNGASGVPIAVNKTEGLRTATLVLKDGSAIGTLMTFNVFLSTEKTLAGDPDDAAYPGTGYAPYTGYASGSLMLTAVNVEPTVQYVQMNGADVVETSGEEFSTTTSQGIECKFAAYSNEPSETDLEALDPTDSEGAFYTRWTFYDGSAAPKTFVVRGNPNAMAGGVLSQTQSFTFQTAGRNRVVVQQMDKDMKDYGEKFTVYVQVNATPGVEIASGRDDGMSAYPETDVGPTAGALSVRLTAACDTELKVGLLVERTKTTDTFALPTLNLDTEEVDHDDNPATEDVTVYVLKFAAGYLTAQQNVYFTFLDGTTAAYKNGVKITPVILTDGTSTYGITYKELYKNLQPFAVYPQNVAPEILEPPEAYETITNQASIGVEYSRPWMVSDVTGDFKSTTAKVELTVEGQTTTIAAGTEADESTITAGGNFTFTFNSTGAKTVTLTVTDKDGAQTTRNLYFMIDPAKNVYVYPHGGNNSALSTLSSVYVNADGLGSGYVWREGVSMTAQDEKYTDRHIHSFDKAATTASFVALGDTDQWWGNGTTANLPTLDSFLFGWIVDVRDDVGNFTGTFMGFKPALGKAATYADACTRAANNVREIALPGGDDFDETSNAYADRYLEAIFAREWRVSDNMGDINADGVPDVFALSRNYAGGTLQEIDEAGGELRNISAANADDDFLPGGTVGLVTGAPSTWGDNGAPFTTKLEIRGSHDGLNYGMFKVDESERNAGWISDLDLSVAEKLCLIAHATANAGSDPADALLNTLAALPTPYTAESLADWLTTTNAAQQAAAKAYIDWTWRGYAAGDASENWGFTVENRTDPTTDDTDGDGMPDGYEYAIWYAATVGRMADGQRVVLTGCKFDREDIESYDSIITSDEIARLYNPNDFKKTAELDTDDDGLYDYEEMLIGTSPVHWDSDMDGLSDLYELLFNLDPTTASTVKPTPDGDSNFDGDFMARDTMDGFYTIFKAGDTYWAFSSYTATTDPESGNTTVDGQAFQVAPFKSGFIPKTLVVTNPMLTTFTSLTNPESVGGGVRRQIDLYHAQVYWYRGFDPRTGWYIDSGNGSLSSTSRWLKDGVPIPGGTPVNTAQFTALDEFLLYKFRKITGMTVRHDSKLTTVGEITLNCTNPRESNDAGQTIGDSEKTYGEIAHGADTDGDGVPDGWELYIGVDPNIDFTIPKGNPGHDPLYWDGYSDGLLPAIGDNTAYDDGLTLVGEYFGTDSTLAYATCESVYANHPSQAGSVRPNWFNKFFPTDPRNKDTDGDGINDGAEGSEWGGIFTYNRWGQRAATSDLEVKEITHNFIYGTPSDSGAKCIRGGGLNPCTIDTDEDGLPDPWERQYAGALFSGSQIVDSQFKQGAPDETLFNDIAAALTAYGSSTNVAAGGYHILMGMDGTANDARTEMRVGAPDLDWDGDGLQNWQEYMVQAMRHLRYDDFHTPLMGFDSPKYDESTGDYVPGGWYGLDENGEGQFLEMSYSTRLTAAELEKVKEIGYTNFVDFVQRYEAQSEENDYLRDLGYLAPPPRAWDHARIDLGNNYMLPPKLIRERPFVSTTRLATVWQFTDGTEVDLMDNTTYASGSVETGEIGSFSCFGMTWFWDETTGKSVEPYILTTTNLTFLTTTAAGYVGTDPRLWDTDEDGMDDYWEIFHGLNPLLGDPGQPSETDVTVVSNDVTSVETLTTYVGAKDVIYDQYYSVSTWRNGWVGFDREWDAADKTPTLDALRYPWMMGTGMCDADGDGLRNEEEALMANLASPDAYHTDPSPLWMTDSTVAAFPVATVETVQTNLHTASGIEVKDANGNPLTINVAVTNTSRHLVFRASPSYTALYYNDDALTSSPFGSATFASYELHEGYDTDGDFRSDLVEMTKVVDPTSDPLNFDDIRRRQSLHFGGADDKGIALTLEPIKRNANAQSLFRQFTVEAWVRPEDPASGARQYVVTRGIEYPAWDLLNSNTVVRLNFALGLDEKGHSLARFDSSTDEGWVEIVGSELEADKWVHLAMTFDGKMLRLYENASLVKSLPTTMIPANGVHNQRQDPQYADGFPYDTYSAYTAATALGGSPRAAAFDAGAAAGATWNELAGDFFKGSVDEVRIWDGARTAAQIAAARTTRYTVDEVKALRQTTFRQRQAGYTRNDNDAAAQDPEAMLDPELIQHYNFTALPGAAEPQYAQKVPAGFATNVLSLVRNPADGSAMDDLVKVGWWSAILTNDAIKANQVYFSPHVVPWIQNTVGHLPRLSGVVADSVYWSENYAGYTPASFHYLDAFTFPNAMNPYNLMVLKYEEDYANNKFAKLDAAIRAAFRYDINYEFTGTSDLLPLGSTFAQRLSESWDGLGPEDAWAITTDGTALDGDADASGIPDWYAGTAADYWKELSVRGLVPDGSVGGTHDPNFVNELDLDGDGLPDWWASLYNLEGGAADDDDKDGLSNYTEYLLSEVFNVVDEDGNRVAFNPRKAYSVSNYDSDYFFKVGQLYVGEIFTDHDLMEDTWEAEMGASYTSRRQWDADGDKDEDGWSAFSEIRYNQFVSGIIAKNITHMINGMEVRDFPTPTVAMTVRYNGTQRLSEADATAAVATNTVVPLVIKAYSDSLTQAKGKLSDATWTLYPGMTVDRVQNLGIWSDRTIHGTLTPGNVDPNSLDIKFSSFNSNDLYVWRLYDKDGNITGMRGGSYEEYLAAVAAYGIYGTTHYTAEGIRTGGCELMTGSSDWASFARDNSLTVTSDDTTEKGYICFHGERVGEINLVTGEYALDLGAFYGYSLSGTNGTTTIANSLVCLEYTATVPTLETQKMTIGRAHV